MMTKKERIVKLEKELEELKQRIQILEMFRVVGVGDNPSPYIPKPYLPDDYKYPWFPDTTAPSQYRYNWPIITWNDTSTSTVAFDSSIQSTLTE